MALIDTPGATNADTYASVATADTYAAEQRLNATDWTGATTAVKEVALRMATRLLDQHMDWQGSLKDQDQALRWPRYGVLDRDDRLYDDSLIPAPLEQATAEMALSLVEKDRLVEPELLGQGFSAAKAGALDVDVDPQQQLDYVPKRVAAMLSHLGSPKNNDPSGPSSVKLHRV